MDDPKASIRAALDRMGDAARDVIAETVVEIKEAHALTLRAERRQEERRRKDRRPKYRCPICDQLGRSMVIESRSDYAANHYWRRHRCLECDETFTTTETVDAVDRPTSHSQNLESARRAV